MAERPEVGNGAESNLTPAEFITLVVAYALLSGLIYDASFFGSFESNLFDLMSVHDHLNSAIEVLPTAILMTAAATVPPALVTLAAGVPRTETIVGSLNWRQTGTVLILCALALILAAILHFLSPQWAIGAVSLVGMLITLSFPSIRPSSRWLRSPWFVTALFLSFWMTASFAHFKGADVTKITPPDAILTSTAGTENIRLIRSLDAGIVYYDPAIKKATFLPWAEVKQLSMTMH